jgi:hypothetical protein
VYSTSATAAATASLIFAFKVEPSPHSSLVDLPFPRRHFSDILATHALSAIKAFLVGLTCFSSLEFFVSDSLVDLPSSSRLAKMESAMETVLILLVIALATTVSLPSLDPGVVFWRWSSMVRLHECIG